MLDKWQITTPGCQTDPAKEGASHVTEPQSKQMRRDSHASVAAEGEPRILDGIRVIDCSENMAGAVAALLLAEAGADVIKVERPSGDPTRSSLGFLTWNRSKRSVVLDLDTAPGRSDLHRLL